MGQSISTIFPNTPFLPYIHYKGLCHEYVLYDEHLGRVYQKWKILTLIHILADYFKSILLQKSLILSCWDTYRKSHVAQYFLFFKVPWHLNMYLYIYSLKYKRVKCHSELGLNFDLKTQNKAVENKSTPNMFSGLFTGFSWF